MSGHYAIPISRYKTILNNVTIRVNKNVTFLATDTNKSKYDTALKLHRQFAHSFPERSIKLIDFAGEHWEKDEQLNILSVNSTKWQNTLKQFVDNLPTNRLSVFDHFVGLALKGLKKQ